MTKARYTVEKNEHGDNWLVLENVPGGQIVRSKHKSEQLAIKRVRTLDPYGDYTR